MSDQIWRDRAQYGDLRSVIDPADVNGNKNRYIDLLQKIALDRHFKIDRSDAVLDFGCGVGRFTEWLEERAGSVIAIDSVPEMVEMAKRLHPSSRCTWMTYTGQAIPLDGGSVDRILSVWVLQHVLDEAAFNALLREFARILRPNGSVALIEQVRPKGRGSVPGYVEHRTAEEYESAFSAAGFRVDHSRPIRAPWRIASAALRRPVPKFMLRPLAEATLFLADRLSANAVYLDRLMVFTKAQSSN
jgi:SAM-dependent methyltransferase